MHAPLLRHQVHLQFLKTTSYQRRKMAEPAFCGATDEANRFEFRAIIFYIAFYPIGRYTV